MPGPDFPTGGVLVEDKAAILAAYETGRGGFRVRAKWEVEKGKHGTWQIVVTEIPYQVQKAKLVEQIAQLLEERKLPLLGDVRDESTEKVRLVLEPKTRGVEPEVLMETLFRATVAGNALSAEHERAGCHAHAAGDVAAGGAARLARSSPRGAGAPHPPSAGRDRAADRDPRRLSAGLSERRRGDPDHPQRGGTEAAADAALQADRHPGRGDPEHAAAHRCAGSRRWRSARSTRRCRRSARTSRRC